MRLFIHLAQLACCCCSVESGCCPTWPWERSWCYCFQHWLQFYFLHSHRSFAIRAFGGVRCFRIETVAIVAMTRQPHRCGPFPCVAFSTSIASCLYLRLGAIPPCPLLPCFSSTLHTFHLRDQTGSLAYIKQISPVNRMIGLSKQMKLTLNEDCRALHLSTEFELLSHLSLLWSFLWLVFSYS